MSDDRARAIGFYLSRLKPPQLYAGLNAAERDYYTLGLGQTFLCLTQLCLTQRHVDSTVLDFIHQVMQLPAATVIPPYPVPCAAADNGADAAASDATDTSEDDDDDDNELPGLEPCGDAPTPEANGV